MSLPESFFSFVFGDGDPNAALRAARVQALAGVIRESGGAVVAEQIAPYLDPPGAPPRGDELLVDEAWVRPWLGLGLGLGLGLVSSWSTRRGCSCPG